MNTTSVPLEMQVQMGRLRRRMQEAVLPFWSTTGFDREVGLFHEQFDFAGRPLAASPRRAMVQARQIYVFSHAAIIDMLPGCHELVSRALDEFLSAYGDGSLGFPFSINPDGSVLQASRDSYTHAFILFALAWAYRAVGDERIRTVCERTLDFVDRHLTDVLNGGLLDRHPHPTPYKQQNPQMHMLEALIALHEAFPGDHYGERTLQIAKLLTTRMIDAGSGGLAEHFNADWSKHSDEAKSCFFEPGHHFEWFWLLGRLAPVSGAPPPIAAERLWGLACEEGIDPSGLVYDKVSFDLQSKVSTYRLWPHAEGARAAFMRLAAGDSKAAGIATMMLTTLNDVFLGQPFPGGWVDRVGLSGKPLVDNVPASSLYHLYGAWVESEKTFADSHPVGSGGSIA